MKFLLLLLSTLCAVLLAALAALYTSGRLDPPAPDTETEEATPERDHRASLFPEQSRAVEDLLQAISARQEVLNRQEERLNEREEQVQQELILLQRLRNELAEAEARMEAYFAQMETALEEWDEDERKNSQKLAEFYARMEPQNAAQLLSEIEAEKAARILLFLGDRQAGAIMDAAVGFGADGMERAVQWSEIIRMMRTPKRADN
jgi:flagellar motility protein MotE (MotC chaperone)